MMASSSSPCAACKFLRRKCTQECVFAPYFPPDNPQKFANVHKVFGASNVAKLLNELSKQHREDAVYSLAFEAGYRLKDPVSGCVGIISHLQARLSHIKTQLGLARKELSNYIGPSALVPINQHPAIHQRHLNNNPSSSTVMQYNVQVQPMLSMGMPTGVPHGAAPHLMVRDPQQQQYLEAQELMRNYEHHHQQGILTFNDVYDPSGVVTATGLNQINTSTNIMHTSLALGGFENDNYHQTNLHHHQQQDGQDHQHSHDHLAHHQPPQLMLNNQQLQQDQQQQKPQQLQGLSSTHQEQMLTPKNEDGLSPSGPS